MLAAQMQAELKKRHGELSGGRPILQTEHIADVRLPHLYAKHICRRGIISRKSRQAARHVLQRFTGRRELLPETINAIAGLVSGKSAGLTW
jgi:hypothetical protein